ncbi:MAG: SPOR domain-containing protein [Nitrospinae bacterium]|nr:SPOR domain-containing protein [Nitrospinota bacterium]
MKRDDLTEEGEKPDNPRSQLYLIVASALVIVVLGFVLVRLLKKGPEPEPAATSAPAPQAVEPPPVPKNEMTSLDNAAPAAPAAPTTPKKPEARPAPPAPTPTVPAISKASPPAPIARAVEPKTSPQRNAPITPAPMVFPPKTQPQKDAPKAAAKAETGLDGAPVPRPSAPASVKPRVKTAKDVERVKPRLARDKEVDVRAEKPRHAAKHPTAKASEPAKPAPSKKSAETLSKKPDEGSFVSEAVRPPPEPFASVAPPATAAQSAASNAEPERQKPEGPTGSEKAKAPKPGFTLLVKSFKGEAEAKDYAQALKKKGYKSFMVKNETTKFTWYQVMAGEFSDREAADKAAEDFLAKEDVRAAVQAYPER